MVTRLTNLRAKCLKIPETSPIILPTTTLTAMAAGLACLELFKVISGQHPCEDYRNTFTKMELPLISMRKPVPPEIKEYGIVEWTVWERWSVHGNITLSELLNWVKEKKGLIVHQVSCGTTLLFDSEISFHWLKGRLSKKVVDVVKELGKVELPDNENHIDVVVVCFDSEGNDITVPLVSIFFR